MTDTPTATQTLTATDTSTSTVTNTATDRPITLTATNTDLPTDTNTPEPTATVTLPPTETIEPTPTRIEFETDAPSVTPTATHTPPESLPQVLEEPSPTATSTEGEEIVILSLPSFTPLPTFNPTEVAELLATPLPRPTLPPTWTAIPTLPPVLTTEAPPESTAPVDISAPNVEPVVSTPGVETPQSQLDRPTLTPSPSATFFQPTVAVRSDLLNPAIQPPISQPTTFDITGASAYQYDVGAGQVFSFENIQLGGGVRLFLQNPVDSNSFLRTDSKGILRFRSIGGAQEIEMIDKPFHPGYGSQIGSYEQNKNRVVELDWSADGTHFSLRVDPPPGMDTSHAGVFFWQPINDPVHGAAYQIIRDCAHEGYAPCQIVNRPGPPYHWKTVAVHWSPIRGDNTVLLNLHLPDEGRNGIAIAPAARDPFYANDLPPIARYDYATWNPNGQSITVSGRRPDGRVIIGAVNRNLQDERIILDGSARGLWLQDAVLLPNGQYVALGRPGGPGSGPLALYDGAGNQLSNFIGSAPAEETHWFPDRSAVVLTVQGQQFTVEIDSGIVSDDTGLVSNPQFGVRAPADAPIPEAVIIGSEYAPGEQLRVTLPNLNIRQQPTTSSRIVGGAVAGDYVAIFAGPYENEGYRWWRVQTANGTFGWVAGSINGAPALRRP